MILFLAAVLSLDSADQGAIGAVAPYLEPSLHITNFQLGLLVTITLLVAVVFTVPMGVLSDRINRKRLLMVMIMLWGGAELALAWALHYMPEPARAGHSWIPRGATAVASVEDVERGDRPEGAGEPVQERRAEGGTSPRGESEPPASERIDADASAVAPQAPLAAGPGQAPAPEQDDDQGEEPAEEANLLEKVQEQGVEPAEEIVLDEVPSKLTLRQAVRYVLKVRTNVVIIIASSLGYFFFAGLKTFALLYVRGHYGISQGVATILVLIVGVAALAGVLLAGRGADSFIGKGRVTARVDIGIVGYTIAAVLLFPAILVTNIGIALVLIMVAAAGIAAPNATLDAARLDIVPAQLWGRAEAVRTVVRTSLEAFAPLTFGFLADWFGGKQGGAGFGVAAGGYHVGASPPSAVQGLRDAFLVMLVPLAVSGVALISARRTYPVDVASAGESQLRMTAAHERDAAHQPRAPGKDALAARVRSPRRPASSAAPGERRGRPSDEEQDDSWPRAVGDR